MLDPKAELANDHLEQFDPFRSRNDSYGTWGPWNLDARARKTAQNYDNFRNHNWEDDEGVRLRPLNTEDDHSPPLWTNSPPRSPVHPRHHVNNYRTLSPTSRTQAIARGQKELMEMVKDMPESCYELSLKDLVEQPRVSTQEECLLQEKNYDDRQQVVAHQRVNIKRQESKKKANITRTPSMDNRGLFLKMVFPVSLKSKKKKNVNSSSTTCAKVSPKPEVSDRTSKSVDKDWWKKRFSASSESDSSGRSSSHNSGSTGSSGSSGSRSSRSSSSSIRRKSGFLTSCLPCFHFRKAKSAE